MPWVLAIIWLQLALVARSACPQVTVVADLPDFRQCGEAFHRILDSCLSGSGTPLASQRCCAWGRGYTALLCHCWRGYGAETGILAPVLAACGAPHLPLATTAATTLVVTTATTATTAAATTAATAAVESIRLFVGVLSAARNRDRRDAIRETWGASPLIHSVRFVCGRPAAEPLAHALQMEGREKGDVVMLTQVRGVGRGAWHGCVDRREAPCWHIQ
jgi:hypothetical protein